MNIYIITLIYLLSPFLIIYLFRKYKIVKQIGTVIVAYAIGIVMALLGAMPAKGTADYTQLYTIQSWIQNITIPLAIPLMLFNCDFKLWTKSLPKTVAALAGGIASIVIAVVAAFFIFRNSGIEDIGNVAAMMTAIYTGGTMNFYALGSSLHVDPDTIVLAYTFEVLITFPFIIFIVGGGYKLFRKLLPFKDESTTIDTANNEDNGQKYKDIEENGVENYSNIFNKKTFPKMMLGLLISLGFLVISAGISMLITKLTTGKMQLNELIIILCITTFAIIATFNKKIRELPKTFELGMFFILIFSIVVASQFDIYSIGTQAISMALFVLFVLVTSVVLHFIFSRISKVPGDLFTVAHIGLLCSPPFIPPVVGAMQNKKVLISGIVIGLIGYAVGTYLGVAIAQFFKLFA
ncbi:DUF819 family protein [Bacteroidales bacterium OttesenSCG-928-B11]|nr:DUF819 family protein [Bacteroidales bacterium OttesenSCG-928-E04]MDL2309090.1 DUF819 family protein [Bacteroidales bacterium OttesenSCG-928-C03]MDL2312199.1 DUF819 family protein [Bacteroidales bacterium OttesenSCG-928-B11]MDL2326233.1 DUF819 family protein [Bacteroidales bacterium OttesenSCG-928-A14]